MQGFFFYLKGANEDAFKIHLPRLCDPTGKPDSHRYGRGSRRVIFFLLGIVLIVTSIMSWVL